MCCEGMRKTLLSSQSGCVEVPMPSSSVEFANSMQSCVYYEHRSLRYREIAACTLRSDLVVTCVAPCVASRGDFVSEGKPEWIGCCVRRKCLRPCLSRYIASSSENADKHAGFGFGNVCAPHLLEYMYWIIHFFTVLSRDHGRGRNSLASKASGRRRTRGCIDGLFFILLLIVANSI